MLIATLSLALLASPQSQAQPAPPRAQHVAQVSVEILAAEEIRFEPESKAQRGPRQQQRQNRIRGGMPMVEFY